MSKTPTSAISLQFVRLTFFIITEPEMESKFKQHKINIHDSINIGIQLHNRKQAKNKNLKKITKSMHYDNESKELELKWKKSWSQYHKTSCAVFLFYFECSRKIRSRWNSLKFFVWIVLSYQLSRFSLQLCQDTGRVKGILKGSKQKAVCCHQKKKII